MTDITKLPYRRCVGIMLLNKEGKVFVGQRFDQTGGVEPAAWQMPQGGIDDGEMPRLAAIRELEEEVGVTPDKAEILSQHPAWLPYDLPEHLIEKVWNGQYRGQSQKWFLMRFLGEDKDINIATEIPEFMAWKWVDVADLVDLVVPFKRDVYIQVVAGFGAHL
ncbi:MAG: RNA pyrophosphohydrolase [Alphaproteobacteria bacterium]